MSESPEITIVRIIVIDWSAGTKCVRKEHIGSVRKFANFPRQIVRRYQESQFTGVCRKTLVSEFKINQWPCRVKLKHSLGEGHAQALGGGPAPVPAVALTTQQSNPVNLERLTCLHNAARWSIAWESNLLFCGMWQQTVPIEQDAAARVDKNNKMITHDTLYSK